MAKKGNHRVDGLKLWGNTASSVRNPLSHGEPVDRITDYDRTTSRRARTIARAILGILTLATIIVVTLVLVDSMARAIALAIVEDCSTVSSASTTPASHEMELLSFEATDPISNSYDDPMSVLPRVTTGALETDPVDVVFILATADNAELAPTIPDVLDDATSPDTPDTLDDTAPTYSEEDLELLAKIVYWEAGATWLPDGAMWKVGSVVLNRVDSPEYPDTLSGVIYQRWQYAGVNSRKFASTTPSKAAYEVAAYLLSGGERAFPPITIGQSATSRGPVREVVEDPYGVLDTIYFFDSTHPEKYN